MENPLAFRQSGIRNKTSLPEHTRHIKTGWMAVQDLCSPQNYILWYAIKPDKTN
jgi:hypothetical protein